MAFVVYKSSAGSGKTATLVLEYLKLCLKNPNDFKRTLAITFTNKAAYEMKSRIIDTLVLISKAEVNFITTELKEYLEISEVDFQRRGEVLLNLITHNYDEFAVSTIDSFVHKIIRTFANELHLPSNFEIILDKDDLIPEILDDLYGKIGHDKQLTDILLSFVFKQIEDEKTHNISSILAQFVNYNLSEDVFAQKKFINTLNINDFVEIITFINKKQNQLKNDIQKSAKQAIDLFYSVSLSADDVSYKKAGIYGYFNKLQDVSAAKEILPGKRNIDTVENDKWLSKNADQLTISAIDEIKDDLTNIFYKIIEDVPVYIMLNFINSKIYSVALVTEIQSLFQEFMERSSKVHISEFNKKISDSIAEQPIPFLYERLGFKFKNFLIDEFQDTSILQWNNLLPLIEESLSNNNFSMLVGDAKQAIYRFRNGEVELFSNLPDLYPKDSSLLQQSRENLLKSQYQEKVLDYNYRSGKTIVEFNNLFFINLLENENQVIKKHYHNLEQIPIREQDSYVKLEIVEADNKEEFITEKHLRIESFVIDAIKAGFEAGDICVLCRSRKSISGLANYLISKNYKVVSSESLLVNNSPKVSMIISLLHMITKPYEKIFLADFIIKYAELKGIENTEELLDDITDFSSETYLYVFQLFKNKIEIGDMLSYSLYEVCEYALRLLNFDKESDIFLQFFLDFVFKSQNSSKYTIVEFLEYWDEKKSKVFVSTPEKPDAIKLMTAHKSKGLAFKVVVVDLNDSVRNNSNAVWADISKMEIPKLPKTLIPLTKRSAEIGFEDEYIREEEKEKLDFLNLVYVSFTRASHALFAVSSNDKRNKFGKYLTDFILKNSENDLVFEQGKLSSEIDKKSGNQNDNYINLDVFPSVDLNRIVKIARSEEVSWNEIESKSPEAYGNLIHKILSEIDTYDNVEKVLNKYINFGFVAEGEKEKLLRLILNVVEHPELAIYFTKRALIKNESDVYDGGGNILRPDRLVILDDEIAIIDYKTGKKQKHYSKQIEEYHDIMRKLGYDKINCFLVYLGDMVNVERLYF